MLPHNALVSVGPKLYAQAQAAWPEIILAGGEESFLRHLARHSAAVSDPSTLLVEDLWLALACSQGHPP